MKGPRYDILMISTDKISKAASDIDLWLPNYLNIPYKHLGNSREGIDCFNLGALVYKEVLGVDIPYSTQDSGCDVSVDWYSKTETSNILVERACSKWGWDTVNIKDRQIFDMILLSIGSTNAPNHCALYLGHNKILQVSVGHTSWVSTYGKYYQQYTVKVCRWNNNFKS
jgi:cell wall-associated NlpC family hydrolase